MPSAMAEIEWRTYKWREKSKYFKNCFRSSFLLTLHNCDFTYYLIGDTADRVFQQPEMLMIQVSCLRFFGETFFHQPSDLKGAQVL